MRSLLSLWRLASPPIASLLIASGLALLGSLSALATPWLGGRFGGDLLSNNTASIDLTLLALLAVLLLQQVLGFFSGYLMSTTSAKATARLRQRLYDHVQALPLSFHQQRNPGETLSMFSRDASILGAFFSSTLPGVVPQLITFFGAWIMMASIDLTLALYIGLLVPVYVIVLRLLLRRIRPLSQQLSDMYGVHLTTVEENLRLLPLLKAFGREAQESLRVGRDNARITELECRHDMAMGLITPITQGLGAVLMVSVLWLSSDRLLQGQLGTGPVISLLLYGLLLFRPAGGLASAAGGFNSAQGAAARIKSTLQIPPEDLATGITEPPTHPGNISFENISFGYPGKPQLFDGFNLQIRAGETIAITGHNGSGKSTLINLLMRFLTPSTGTIFLDGIDSSTLSLATLRSLVGLVPQQVTLLNDSVRENIRYGNDRADDQAVMEAAKRAQAWEFIENLPAGLDTRLGPDGIRLSGGQRQRIALARALLRECPILVFDEATSMFDLEGEQRFVDMSHETLKDTTVIIITHRPGSLALADRVISFPLRPDDAAR